MTKLNLEIDLNRYYEGPVEEHIVNVAIDRIVEGVDREARKRVVDAVEARIMAIVESKLDAVIEDFMTKPRPNVNQYGEPKGPDRSFGERIEGHLDDYLSQKVNPENGERRDYDRSRWTMPRYTYIGFRSAHQAIKKMIAPKIEEAVASSLAAIEDQCVTVMKEAVGNALAPKKRR